MITTTGTNQTFSIGLAAAVAGVTSIDWMDGSACTAINYTTSGNYQTYSHTYSIAGPHTAILYNPSNIKSICKDAPTYLTSMSISQMRLTYLFLSATGTACSGSISGMRIEFILLASASGIKGSITGMPLTYFNSDNSGIIGSIDNMSLTFLLANSSPLTGTLSTSSRLTRLYLFNSTSVKIPSSGLTFGANLTNVLISQTVGLPKEQTDALIYAAARTTWAGAKTFTCAGNSSRSSASNADITTLTTTLSVSVTVNNPT